MISRLEWQNFQANTDDFKDKTILVTGAANGIGRALSIELAKLGTQVLMLDKKLRHLEKLYDSIVESGGTAPVILPVDLNELDASSATVIAQGIADDIGKLDGLVHNAAELGSPSPMDQYDMTHWQEVMQVNQHAPYLLTRAVLPLLKQVNQSQVMFTTADVARTPQAYWGAYAIAYAGVEAQMTLWSEEQEQISNIKFNSIDPGAVRTSFRRRSHPGESQEQLPTPQEIINAYLLVLSGHHEFNGAKLKL
jgi:NAD(P)-dependent dehydrogenase (short-subunit alcohol dehydrogenase family)